MALSSASTQKKNAILESGQAAMAERQRQFQQHVVSSLATLEELRRIAPPASQTMMAEALHKVRAHEQASGQIMALTMAGQDAEASQLSLGEARRARMRADEILTSVVQANRKEIAEESAMAAAAQEDLRRPLILAALLGLAFAFAMLFWIARYQISLPLSRITQGMGRVAAGELEVFKQNALEARRPAAEQAREQEAKEGRAARLNTLIRSFKGSVNVLTGHLASVSTELEATAQPMSEIAKQANEQAGTVSTAAQSTGNGVQTVAAATEQLAAAIGEISRQVAQATSVAQRSVRNARDTDHGCAPWPNPPARSARWWA